ncbi:MAG: YbjN domain-containing protein [Planctomycetota bacterium]
MEPLALAELLIAHFSARGWSPQRAADEAGQPRWAQAVATGLGVVSLEVVADGERQQVVVRARDPLRVPAESRALAGEVLHRANRGLRVATLELDLDAGEVRATACLDHEDLVLSACALDNLIRPVFAALERYGPALRAALTGALDPREAIEAAERDQLVGWPPADLGARVQAAFAARAPRRALTWAALARDARAPRAARDDVAAALAERLVGAEVSEPRAVADALAVLLGGGAHLDAAAFARAAAPRAAACAPEQRAALQVALRALHEEGALAPAREADPTLGAALGELAPAAEADALELILIHPRARWGVRARAEGIQTWAQLQGLLADLLHDELEPELVSWDAPEPEVLEVLWGEARPAGDDPPLPLVWETEVRGGGAVDPTTWRVAGERLVLELRDAPERRWIPLAAAVPAERPARLELSGRLSPDELA